MKVAGRSKGPGEGGTPLNSTCPLGLYPKARQTNSTFSQIQTSERITVLKHQRLCTSVPLWYRKQDHLLQSTWEEMSFLFSSLPGWYRIFFCSLPPTDLRRNSLVTVEESSVVRSCFIISQGKINILEEDAQDLG